MQILINMQVSYFEGFQTWTQDVALYVSMTGHTHLEFLHLWRLCTVLHVHLCLRQDTPTLSFSTSCWYSFFTLTNAACCSVRDKSINSVSREAIINHKAINQLQQECTYWCVFEQVIVLSNNISYIKIDIPHQFY